MHCIRRIAEEVRDEAEKEEEWDEECDEYEDEVQEKSMDHFISSLASHISYSSPQYRGGNCQYIV